tara:strand:- start:161 stop:670 length:510 start_codon:yes stop_codon:yes gene_type:complete
MLNLSLIRHAKSDWDYSIQDDMDRPISKKGINKTKKICEFLKKKKLLFEEVFCSPSKRTKETLDIIIKYLPREPSIYFLENLYHTSTIDIFDTVMLEAKKKKVLIVSHQPLLSNSIDNFFSGSQNKHYFNAITSYPTSALFNVSFKCDKWHQILKSNSFLNFFIKPSEL